MKSSMKIVGVMGTLVLLLAVSGVGQSAPAFSPTVITGSSQNYSISLNGYNFGSSLCNGNGQDCAYFRIGDPTCNKTNPGECEAGYLGDAYGVNFNSWATIYNLVGVVKRHVECPRLAGPSMRRCSSIFYLLEGF